MKDAKTYRSSFGGGWIVPITRRAKIFLREWFDADAAPIEPLGGQFGWIVEPQQTADLTRDLEQEGLTWCNRSGRI